MPISDKNLGKYKVPAIYIEEVDQSMIERPVQEILINLVPGFSRKGPINKPVRVNSSIDFESIFGSVDKGLEIKGSYFHRTVLTMLEQGPVWALNLLKTDPNRDKLQWKSISVTSQYDNGSLISSPYERFFNRQDFWERDPDAFMDVVVENNSGVDDVERLLHITNMSDRTITVFMFKSDVRGFDITAEEWYGGRDKVPPFMSMKDWISDYMVSILIVYGDWSDYHELSSDDRWSTYFNESGLLKTKVEDFANHVLVTRLAYYDACLIPNFRDLNGRDMYIKNVINNDTDKTGLFCTYNEDILINSDCYNGKIDLLGQTLVGSTKKSINFLSYYGNMDESITIEEKNLDSVSNVFGNYAVDMTTEFVSGRTAQYTNWYTYKITGLTSDTDWQALTSCDGTGLTLASVANFYVDDIIYFNKSFSIIDSTKAYYVVSNDGTQITISTSKAGSVINGISSGTTTNIYVYKLSWDFLVDSGNFYNIGAYRYNLSGDTSQILPAYLNPFSINTLETSYSRYDILYLNSDSTKINIVQGSQIIGSSSVKPNFILDNDNTIILGYVKTEFSGTTSGATSQFTITYTGVTVDNSGYMYLDSASDITYNSGITSAGINYLDIIFEGTYGSSSDWKNYEKLRKLKIFEELSTKLSVGKGVIINMNTGYKFEIPTPSFYDATISEDARIRIYLDDTENPFDYITASNQFIIYYVDDEFLVGNGNVLTIDTSMKPRTLDTEGVVAKYSAMYLDFLNGTINNYDYIWYDNDSGTTQKLWLKMIIDDDDLLHISFLDQLDPENETYINGFTTSYGAELIIYSDKNSLKQTVEIDNPSSIVDLTNTVAIYVNKDRYSEVTKGSFLEAYYDPDQYDSIEECGIYGCIPKKYVRIVDVKNDTVDTTLKILYTDGPIKISNYYTGTTYAYYTTCYSSIDNYFDEYKGIAIQPFVIHCDSIPNGTETRQDTILDCIDQATRLGKGLANKNRISWRYLVDSFGLGLTANSKQQYLDLCGAKLNCLGFINMPSYKSFRKSSNPSFVDEEYAVNMEYVKQGADPSKNPDFYYSFGEGIGQSCVSYWFPYIKTDQESMKFIPPAGEIAKTYMKKFTTINPGIKPWTILGGVVNGALPNVKETEIRFTQADLIPLHEMNANPIDYIENYGYIINSDNSAQVFPYSSLSLIHSREVLIELENRLYDMLLNYHWRFNTPEIRAEIKYRADSICKELKEADALYAYRNVCDKTNNTDYIIDLQMGVLDTYIEIIKGMGIIVNQITILKKGTIESSGFRA